MMLKTVSKTLLITASCIAILGGAFAGDEHDDDYKSHNESHEEHKDEHENQKDEHDDHKDEHDDHKDDEDHDHKDEDGHEDEHDHDHDEEGTRNIGAHEHGVSVLKMAQQGDRFDFELEAPGADVVGFEHAPENDAEKASIEAALTTLGAPEKLFTMPAAANCTRGATEAEFETSADHAEFHVTWSMTCQNPAAVNMLSISYFSAFERAEEVEVEAFGDKGQTAFEVEKDETSLDISSAFGG